MHEVTETNKKHRILIYGNPKVGKTRLALAAPWGKIAYIAADPGSETLGSVLPRDRERTRVFKPRTPGKKYDPWAEAAACASKDWAADGFETIIWDTLTKTSQDILAAYAKLKMFGENIEYGVPGTVSHVAQPQMGDYGATQQAIRNVINFLFDQPIHVIIVCHAAWAEPEKAGGGIIGGPATVGQALVRELAGDFPNLLHVEASRKRVGPNDPLVETYQVRNQPHGIWIAGTRVPGKSIPDIKLKEDPLHFWHEWEKGLS